MELTQERLKELLSYDSETGAFTWRQTGRGRRLDCKAGSLDGRGYLQISIARKSYKAHHLAWLYCYGILPQEIDHKNGIRTDNKLENLRLAERWQNAANKPGPSRSHDLPKGVHPFWTKKGRKGPRFIVPDKFRAVIQSQGQQIHLGVFSSIEDASAAYAKAAEKFHGEFARFV